MKNIVFATYIVIFCSMFSLNAEDVNIIMKKGGHYSFSEEQVSPDSSTSLKIIRNDKVSEVQEFLFPSRICTDGTRTDGNEMRSISFLSLYNNHLCGDIHATFDASSNAFYAVMPYSTQEDLKNTVASFEAAGSVFVMYASDAEDSTAIHQLSGKSVNDMSMGEHSHFGLLHYRCVDVMNNIANYSLYVRNNLLPVVRLNFEGSLENEWKVCGVEFDDESSKKGTIKWKKKDDFYKIKLDKKTPFSNLPSSKRWVLFPAEEENPSEEYSYVRRSLLSSFAQKLRGEFWHPSTKPVELVVKGEYKGLYYLGEDIRTSDGKISNAIIYELNDKADADEIFYETSVSKTVCKVEDTDLDESESLFANASKVFDDFEKTIFSADFSFQELEQFVDLTSFADWYVLHELAKVDCSNFDGDVYAVVSDNVRLSMGPVAFPADVFEGDPSGFVTRKNVWFRELLKNSDFVELAIERLKIFSTIYPQVVRENMEMLKYRMGGEHYLSWNQEALDDMTAKYCQNMNGWIQSRVEWLDFKLKEELSWLQNVKATSNNEIKSFGLETSSNSKLLENYVAKIVNDTVMVRIPYLYDFQLVPTFSTSGEVFCEGEKVESGKTKLDFSKPLTFVVKAQSGETRQYVVSVKNNGLPVIHIEAPFEKGTITKTEWLSNCKMTVYHEDGTLDYFSGEGMMNIKGRGNSTWDASQKKPYAIKLNEKSEILGLLEHKRWVLLANHYDRSFIRAGLASWLAKRLTNQDWTPSGFSVELIFNNEHVGNYFFCEQVKVDDDRVDSDYLLEVDTKAKQTFTGGDDITFETSRTGNLFNIKYPEVTIGDSEYTYLKEYINKVEQVLYNESLFLDPNEGYKKYCDLESFVDWSLIKELSKDYDANFFTSCFMNLSDGVLKMGPLWDFDLAFCNNPFADLFGGFGGGWGGGFGGGTGVDYEYYNEPEGFHVLEADWLNRMMLDPEFKSLMRKKIDHLIAHEEEIFRYIDEQAALNKYSFISNEYKWKTLAEQSMWGSGTWNYDEDSLAVYYDKDEIEKMKNFIRDRLRWMQSQF